MIMRSFVQRSRMVTFVVPCCLAVAFANANTAVHLDMKCLKGMHVAPGPNGGNCMYNEALMGCISLGCDGEDWGFWIPGTCVTELGETCNLSTQRTSTRVGKYIYECYSHITESGEPIGACDCTSLETGEWRDNPEKVDLCTKGGENQHP